MLNGKIYSNSGFDRGHMVPAEDFAYNDSLQGLTFRYYNCVPQYPKVNRGAWKKYETKVRKMSQLDTLVVVCYNTYDKKLVKGMYVPKVCYKVVFNTKRKMIFSVGVQNSDSSQVIFKVPRSIVYIAQKFITK